MNKQGYFVPHWIGCPSCDHFLIGHRDEMHRGTATVWCANPNCEDAGIKYSASLPPINLTQVEGKGPVKRRPQVEAD